MSIEGKKPEELTLNYNKRLIKSDLIANNVLPIVAAIMASMGFDQAREDVFLRLAFMGGIYGSSHALQFIEAYCRRAMTVRRYVNAVLHGTERLRGEDSLY